MVKLKDEDDKFYIYNSGELPDNLKDDLYAKHFSTPYNPKIAQVFFKAGFTESWGRGFTEIKESCKQYECPLPELYMDKGGTMILCKASERYLKMLNTIGEENVPLNVHLNEREQKIISIIDNNPSATSIEIAEQIGVTEKTIKRYFLRLQEDKVINRVGSKKTGHWEIIK